MIGTRIRKHHLTIFSYGSQLSAPTYARYFQDKQAFELSDAYKVYDGFFEGEDMYLFGEGRYLYSSSYYDIACYWKNGVKYEVTSESGGQNSEAHKGQIIGSDVYLFGSRMSVPGDGNSYRACYWKNGVLQWEDTGSNKSEAFDGIIIGSDVYLFGIVDNPNYEYPCYWKNGSITIMPISGQRGWCYGGIVDGSDIYLIGYEYDATYYRACYWLNSVKTWLGGYGILHTRAYYGFLKDSDLYTFGVQQGYGGTYSWGCYWKNTTQETVGNLGDYSLCYKGLFYGDDLYMFGLSGPSSSNFYPSYWRNRTVQYLGYSQGYYLFGIAHGGFVKNPR